MSTVRKCRIKVFSVKINGAAGEEPEKKGELQNGYVLRLGQAGGRRLGVGGGRLPFGLPLAGDTGSGNFTLVIYHKKAKEFGEEAKNEKIQ